MEENFSVITGGQPGLASVRRIDRGASGIIYEVLTRRNSRLMEDE